MSLESSILSSVPILFPVLRNVHIHLFSLPAVSPCISDERRCDSGSRRDKNMRVGKNVEPGEHPMIADTLSRKPLPIPILKTVIFLLPRLPLQRVLGQLPTKSSRGESLASIAKTYNVAPEQIKSWNSLRRNAVRTGQLLRINTASGEGEAELLTAEATEVPAGGERTWQSDAPASSSGEISASGCGKKAKPRQRHLPRKCIR